MRNGYKKGFNPYFTGSNSGSYITTNHLLPLTRFNPYFTGSNSGSDIILLILFYCNQVSILILLEVILEVI